MTASVNILTQISNTDHERVQICRDEATGLHAIIAVHSTRLGPALAPVRMLPYASEEEALGDVLRQSRSMTFKAALTGLPYGGGAAVIIGDSRSQKSALMLRSFARFADSLGGNFVVTQDRGFVAEDLETIREVTPHVARLYGNDGDSSPFTAYGVFVSIVTAIRRLTGSEDLYGRRVLVQGIGRVGLALVRRLLQAGATVYVCDIRDAALREAVFAGARVVPPSAVHSLMVDVFVPCATGGVLNPTTIPQLRCAIVAGAAENQLLDEERDSQALHDRGILYVPDFVANAGGLIAISAEAQGRYQPELAGQVARNIQQTLAELLDDGYTFGLTPHQAAIRRVKMHLRTANRESSVWGRTQFRYQRHMLPLEKPSPFGNPAGAIQPVIKKEHLAFLRAQALNS